MATVSWNLKGLISPPQSPTTYTRPGRRTFRVRKCVSMEKVEKLLPQLSPTANTTSQSNKRKIQVAKRMLVRKPHEQPIPGSIEDDFLLERRNDKSKFLAIDQYPEEDIKRYDSNGNLVTIDDLRKTLKNTPGSSLAVILQSQLAEATARHVNRLTQKQVELPATPQDELLKRRLKEIEDGQKKEEKLRKKREAALSPGARIGLNKQNQILQKHEKRQKYWNNMSNNMSEMLQTNSGDLVLNRGHEYREKIEDCDFLDRIQSSEEKAGLNAWYMSLRNPKQATKSREHYEQVGNVFSGIYIRRKERLGSPEAVIRSPNAPKSTKHRAYKNSDFFTKKISNGVPKNELKPVESPDIDDLIVYGSGKLDRELQAVKQVGAHKLIIPKEPPAKIPDEVIAEQYDVNNFY